MPTKSDVEQQSDDWEAYSSEFREFMRGKADQTNGMVLNANDYFDGYDRETGRAAFELSSGRFQREFITFWEFFDEREVFHRCVGMLAKRAREIYAVTPFSVILTCTETSKCLMEHVHSLLDLGGEEIRLQYLGHYPHLGIENRETIEVENRSVLLLTDVVAKGALVSQLADVVADRGGDPVAALSVVLIDESLIKELQTTGESPFLDFGHSGRKLRVHSLVQDPIPDLPPGDFDEDKVIKIDPVTVLPEEKLEISQRFPPAFRVDEMYAHFEDSDAIDFGYFESESGKYTTAVRIDRLLEHKGNEIWTKIHGLLESQELLDESKLLMVTTFGREDMRFKEFVEDRYSELVSVPSLSFAFVPKRDSLESPKSYFLLPQKARKLDGKHAILLLSTVHTAEKLSNLSSLIATRRVESITAICLINRMGAETDGFVSRIERVLRGLGIDNNDHARFNFIPLYTISDLSANDLAQTRDTLESVFRTYRERTRVLGFKRWVDRAREFALPQRVSSPAFSQGIPIPLPKEIEFPWTKTGQTVRVRSHEGMLSVLCSYAVTRRDYTPLLEYAKHTDRMDVLFKLLPVVLSDLSFLKNTGRFEEFRNGLIDKFRKVRDTRFAIERDSSLTSLRTGSEIRQIIEREMDVLLVICGLAYLDELHGYADLIFEVVTCNKTSTEWLSWPLNLKHYYGYDRVPWTISMLVHLAYTIHGTSESEVELRTELRAFITGLVETLNGEATSASQPPVSSEQALENLTSEDRQKVKTALESLLNELGAHEQTEKHQLIRYLHSRVVSTARHHSPINNSLTDTFRALEAEADAAQQPSGASVRSRIVRIRNTGSEGVDIKVALEDAINVTGVLQDVADASARWLFVTPTSRAELGRYLASVNEEGLARDVKSLGDFLQAIRTTGVFRTKDLEEAVELMNGIFFDLWDRYSPLRKELLRYVVSFRKVLEDALSSANTMLDRAELPGVWLPKGATLSPRLHILGTDSGVNPDDDWNVLIDPQLLKEVLRNVLYNVRYNLRKTELREKETWSDLVFAELGIERGPCPLPEPGEIEYVVFRVVSGRTPPDGKDLEKAEQGTTFSQHRLEIAGYGGSLELKGLPNRDGAEVTLRLISRRGTNISKQPQDKGGS